MPTPTTIGILSPLLSNRYFGQLVRGVQDAAQRSGARVLAIQTRDAWALFGEYGRSRSFTHRLAWEHVDGWVVILDAVAPEYLRALHAAGKPLVSISWPYPELGCPTVMPDNRGGARDVVQHLLDHGHTRIAFAGYLAQTDIQERYQGYQEALRARGIEPDPALCFEAPDNEYIGGRAVAEQILAAGVPCTAVVAAADMNAQAIMDVLQAAGVRVPQDVAVVGFDDMESSQYTLPALTTVRQRFSALGYAAGELLLAKLAGQHVPGGPHRVPCTLITRRSCGCSLDIAPLDLAASPGATWQEQLAADLVRLVYQPAPVPSGAAPDKIWPGVAHLVAGLEAALSGAEGPAERALARAWQEATAITSDLRALQAVVTRLGEAAEAQAAGTDDAARTRVKGFLSTALSDMLHTRLRAEVERQRHFESIIQQNYDITQAALAAETDAARRLDWLRLTPAASGCLALWSSDFSRLKVEGAFQREGPPPTASATCRPEEFPPAEMIEQAARRADVDTLMLLPVRSPRRDLGILAVVGPVEAALESGRSIFSVAASNLNIALEREELLQSLVAQQRSLQDALEREQALASTVRQIGSPIIPLLPRVLLIPLIGTIDTARAQQLIEVALDGISRHRATEVLLDLTGVPLVDTQVAAALIRVTRAATLLGAHVTLVGVRPEIAQSMVSLGIDLSFITTRATLSAAVEELMRSGHRAGLRARA